MRKLSGLKLDVTGSDMLNSLTRQDWGKWEEENSLISEPMDMTHTQRDRERERERERE